MEEILRRGHELAHHSYSHAWILNPHARAGARGDGEGLPVDQAGQRQALRAAGARRRPRSARSPCRCWSNTASTTRPTSSTTTRPTCTMVEGKETEIVELPFRWVLDDAPFFQYSIVLPGRTMQAPSALLEAWKGEFDVLYAEDRMMMVGMHPEIIGQPSRIKALEGLDRACAEASECLDRPLRRDRRRHAPRPR